MKRMDIRAGERRRILHLVSDSIPRTIRFSARPAAGTGLVAGVVEVKGSNWLFPRAPVVQALAADNAVPKRWMDTFYSIYVTPDQDMQVTVEGPQFTAKLFVIVLAAVLVVGLAAALVVYPMVGQ